MSLTNPESTPSEEAPEETSGAEPVDLSPFADWTDDDYQQRQQLDASDGTRALGSATPKIRTLNKARIARQDAQ